MGKAKGAQFERHVCALLSRWITNGKRDDCFWRSAMSGGRATVQTRKGKANRQAGDITAVSREGHKLTDKFYIECKSYRSLDIGQFLFETGKLAAFWRKTVEEAKKHHRNAILIAKENRGKILLICDHRVGDYICSPSAAPVAKFYPIEGNEVIFYLLDEVMCKRYALEDKA